MTFDGDQALDQIELANKIVAEARSRIGLHWPDPKYVAAVLPNDIPAHAFADARTMWSCGLDALGILRAVGVDAPELHWSYEAHIGQALAMLCAIADRCDSRDAHQPIDPPEPGDVVCLDHAGGHISVVTDIDGDVTIAVDGGQVWPGPDHPGARAILERRRVYMAHDGVLYASQADQGHGPANLGAPTKVLWVIRAPRLRTVDVADTEPPSAS